MPSKRCKIIAIAILLALGLIHIPVSAQEKLVLKHSDQFEVIKRDGRFVSYVVGNVSFETETGMIYCDSARWIKGEQVVLNGKVYIDDEAYQLRADSVHYEMTAEKMLAQGQLVELWSYSDSTFASGTHAYYDKKNQGFYMLHRPVLFLNYPDSSRMIEIIADRIDYDGNTTAAEAAGKVKISSTEFSATAECATMNGSGDTLDLYDNPTAIKGESSISGGLISLYFTNNVLEFIDVIDSAYGEFKEPVDSVKGYYDESILSGNRLKMFFEYGDLAKVLCYGQAYSWYYPSSRGRNEKQENAVSGDTITFFVEQNQLQRVDVNGGAIGQYLNEKITRQDSLITKVIDTIDYVGQYIEYAVVDSVIKLRRRAHVKSGTVNLDAYIVEFDTKQNIIEAFSADTVGDSAVNPYLLSEEIQPNVIPVRLKDVDEEIFGDYLLYSIDTEKGRILQSKTNYRTGYYYGQRLVREQDEIYYVHDGRYTTCNAHEPHFHFKSTNMKLMENNKLIAKPVVFYVEQIPVFALPFYIFPLQKGRHSGVLPFTFGQFERGERYVKNVGYYWAASEYWDWQGSMDYYEQRRTLNFRSRVNFKKRYVLDGYVTGNYTRETGFNSSAAVETKSTRWTLQGAYNHTITPSFTIRSNADFVSDASYYSDFSQNLEDRINRSIKSQVSFTKKFGSKVSLSGNISHTENLDTETRTDYLPNLNLSLPVLYPFGSASKNDKGQTVQRWYQKFSLSYRPNLTNFSTRITVDSLFTDSVLVDTVYVVSTDTTSSRSRRHYAKINHNPSINLPSLKLGNYLNLIPRFSYNETWFKIYETDQSQAAGIDASTVYRTYSYSAGLSANTTLYGTVYPNLFGLVGLRHVVTPSVNYTYRPDIDRHPDVRSFAGGGAGSVKSQLLSVSLRQLLQAKIKQGELEKNLQLVSLTSSFSYNLEKDSLRFSNLSTSFQSSALPIITSLNGSMTHSLYKEGSSELDFWSPKLQSFNINANLNLAGDRFIFDDPGAIPRGVDSAHHLPPGGSFTNYNKGWSFSASYSYNESGRGAGWSKSSFIYFNLRFNLTPSTQLTYSQRYDIGRKLTISNSVNIVRKIHCWTGSLYWVPTGTNRGFGFRLFVSDMPEIKVDSNYDSFTSSLR